MQDRLVQIVSMAQSQVLTQGVEYVEYAVRDLEESSKLYEKMGFTCVGLRREGSKLSKLFMQGDIRIVLSTSTNDKDGVSQFVSKHGDGVLLMGYRVEDAAESHAAALQKGAKSAYSAQTRKGAADVAIQESAIHVFGDVLTSFVSHDNKTKFEDLFTENHKPLDSHKGRFLQTIDHITVNVEKGQVDRWVSFYKDIFAFYQVREFDIRTEKTGLFSRAMRNPNGRVTMPFNEPTNEKSQIQEFIDVLHGPGVQHIAFHTSNIISCLDELNKHSFKFLTVPETYYDAVPKRVPNVTEDMKTLSRLGILVDGSPQGYLLQIFTEPVVGPFFFEFIQRKGDNGFGDGNFRALFEAIERDQMRRGYL